METDDEWITSRTGVRERRISHVSGIEMAHVAVARALACAPRLEVAGADGAGAIEHRGEVARPLPHLPLREPDPGPVAHGPHLAIHQVVAAHPGHAAVIKYE
jgi:hypothetical protein